MIEVIALIILLKGDVLTLTELEASPIWRPAPRSQDANIQL